MSDLISNIEKTPDDKDICRTVVRLRRSYWSSCGEGINCQITLRYLKRFCRGYNVIREGCFEVGVEKEYKNIINLDECKDGIYEIITVNESRDWETGHIESWQYMLIPFNQNV